MRKVLGVLVVSLFALSSTTAAAAAAPERPVRALLQLRIVPVGDADGAVARTDGPSRVLLTCSPDGGTHPSPTEACESLRAVGGQFARLPTVPDMFCPMIYDPVRVEAFGRWGGRWVSYSEVFGNRCEAAVGTDMVFDL